MKLSNLYRTKDQAKIKKHYDLVSKRLELLSRETKSSYFYGERSRYAYVKNSRRIDAASWCALVDGLDIDFSFQSQFLDHLEPNESAFSEYSDLVSRLISAIRDYIEHKAEVASALPVSEAAARNYFYLIPVLFRRAHEITIDADTGFVSVALLCSDDSVMTALITGRGDIHYSYVGRGTKIVKISGVAKIKHSRDFGRFERVLRML
ncbi:hypothetical protein JNB91_23700 [Rhizobium wenxiniae]|uniref:hypothetical protein n=1 Tax=Rhizobium wenxiniae TaxID=1737357 RepID=UPI001C6E1637|nr:hypothetical protein [Rhizobium wenxiniae]MBW9090820.1 hypothetical protein [Rhizobium wenxiniae]